MAEHYDNSRWLKVIVKQPNVKIKRVDLTIDDLQGTLSIEKVDKKFSRGLFKGVTGCQPKKRNMGDKKSGRTRYIGGPTAYKQACIYEKGKQQKLNCAIYIDWVRFEVRFNSNGRDVIPKDILDFKEDFFVCAYPRVLKRLVCDTEPTTIVERKEIEYSCLLKRSIENSSHQYGKINRVAVETFGKDRAIELLTRAGSSKTLKRLPFIRDKCVRTISESLFKENV